MMWSIKHKSGRVLFVTDSKVTADNREKMGWIVEGFMNKCPKCNGTGLADSGGMQPWGESILIECDCKVVEVKMTSREQFEEWFSDGINEGMKVSASGGYENLITQTAWMAWQASRAAIEVELPDVYGDKYTPSSCTMDGFDFEQYLKDLCATIESAGLKVKK